MATSFGPPGQVSPTMFSRTLERVFEDAQHTGEINISGRNLKEYSKVAEKFDLVDTTTVGEFIYNPDVQSFLFICLCLILLSGFSDGQLLYRFSQSNTDTLLCCVRFPSGLLNCGVHDVGKGIFNEFVPKTQQTIVNARV